MVLKEHNSLIGLTKEEIGQQFEQIGIDKKTIRMRVFQLWNWMYFRGVTSFEEMTTISKDLRVSLSNKYTIGRAPISSCQISKDKTRKWLISFGSNSDVETVYIPEKKRGALCISSQIGCTLNCKFCFTGTMPLVRNLSADEIVSQILIAKDELNDWPEKTDSRILTNIVMMGMGEPLYNYNEVAKALNILTDADGINISKRKITLSTAGIVPMIKKLGEEFGVGLAISLHAVRDDLRSEIIPINRKYPIKELMDVLRFYPKAKNSRRITFEYVMLKGINYK